jgi:hypothetical protein
LLRSGWPWRGSTRINGRLFWSHDAAVSYQPTSRSSSARLPRARFPAVAASCIARSARPAGRLRLPSGRSGFVDNSGAVGANPPQGRPVVVVVVHEHGHEWVFHHVGHTAAGGGRLGFGVDDTEHPVPVDREHQRHQARLPCRSDYGQACHASGRNRRRASSGLIPRGPQLWLPRRCPSRPRFVPARLKAPSAPPGRSRLPRGKR